MQCRLHKRNRVQVRCGLEEAEELSCSPSIKIKMEVDDAEVWQGFPGRVCGGSVWVRLI